MEFKKLALAAALIAAGTTTAFANQDTAATTDKSDKSAAQAQSPMASTNGATADKPDAASANGSTAASTNGDAASGNMAAAAGDESVRQLQQALKDKGFDPGPIDGIMGPRTQDAIEQAKQAGVTVAGMDSVGASTSASSDLPASGSASTNQPSGSASTNQPASSASANQPSAASESASQTKQ